jgi:hypothetical protein
VIRLVDYALAVLIWLVAPISLALMLFLERKREDAKWLKDGVWVSKMEQEGCNGAFEGAEYLHHRHFLHTSIIAAAFGSIIGQLFEWQLFINRGLLKSSQWTWHETSFLPAIARIIATFGFIFVIALLPATLRQFNFDMAESTE